MTQQPVQLSLNAPAAEPLEVFVALENSVQQCGALRWLPVAVGAVGPFVAICAATIAGWNPAPAAIMAVLVVWAIWVAQGLDGRTQRAACPQSLQASAFRTQPTPVTLSVSGLQRLTGNFLSAQTPQVTRRPGMTLLHVSGRDGNFIRDMGLPFDLSPDALAARMALWRSA